MINIDYYIQQLGNRTNMRFDCPACGGEYSFSVSRVNGKVKYHCFRNSCPFAGVEDGLMSPDAIRNALQGRTEEERPFSIPDYWTKGISSEKCLKMLLKTNCLKPYKEGKFNVAYDPKLNRLCWLIRDFDSNRIVGAVGRTLANDKPKAYNYPGSAKIPFTVKNGDKVVVVEDCASAASITRINGYSGLALQGTVLKEEYLPKIIGFSDIIVALDLDATKKSIAIKSRLSYYHSHVGMWRLRKDIKDMTDKELEEYVISN